MIKKIPPKPGVYCLWSYERNRAVYVGSTNNLRRRQCQHKHAGISGTYTSHTLAEHCRVYGDSDLSFIPLVYCESNELTGIESELIETLRTHTRHGGYNIREDVNTNRGIKAYKPSWNTGMPVPESTRERISISTKRTLARPEVKAKMSLAAKSRPGSRLGIKTGKPSPKARPILVKNMSSQIEEPYSSLQCASVATGVSVSDICAVAAGRQKTAKGFIFSYKQ